jgi:hypothetical protein
MAVNFAAIFTKKKKEQSIIRTYIYLYEYKQYEIMQ